MSEERPQRHEALDAGQRLRRLLAVLAYLARVGEAPIEELARRFSMDGPTLVSELELAACCGLPPYTPDQLLELVIDDERVVAYGLEALRRPPRLTPEEGFAVAAAARALLAVPGADPDGPLAHALAKLERALGEDRLRVELDTPEFVAPLRRAVLDRELVEIDYLGAARGSETTRTVEPHAVVALEGRFYLDAFCHLADDWRRFQIDRIAAIRPRGARFSRRALPDELSGPSAFSGGPGARTARIALSPAQAPFLAGLAAAPPESLEDGRVVVAVRVGNADWFGRLLLRLGPAAEVIDPPELAGARTAVAEKALARYRSASGGRG